MENHSCNTSGKLEEVIAMETAPAKQVQKRGAARERDARCTE